MWVESKTFWYIKTNKNEDIKKKSKWEKGTLEEIRNRRHLKFKINLKLNLKINTINHWKCGF